MCENLRARQIQEKLWSLFLFFFFSSLYLESKFGKTHSKAIFILSVQTAIFFPLTCPNFQRLEKRKSWRIHELLPVFYDAIQIHTYVSP